MTRKGPSPAGGKSPCNFRHVWGPNHGDCVRCGAEFFEVEPETAPARPTQLQTKSGAAPDEVPPTPDASTRAPEMKAGGYKRDSLVWSDFFWRAEKGEPPSAEPPALSVGGHGQSRS